jgi:hypothetical protein
MMQKLGSLSREDFFPHQQREYWHRGRRNGTMQTEAERKIAKLTRVPLTTYRYSLPL